MENSREILIIKGESQQKITIPSEWKVTFGVPVGAKGMDIGRGRDVRIYEGKDCRGVFTNVIEFRDLSIIVEEESTNIKGQTRWIEKRPFRSRYQAGPAPWESAATDESRPEARGSSAKDTVVAVPISETWDDT